jgi:hypothetical protein
VALLLAFGKFFVLYKPLSLLPGIGSIAIRTNSSISSRWRGGAGGVRFGRGAANGAARGEEMDVGRGHRRGAVRVVGLGAVGGFVDGRGAVGGGGVGRGGRAIQWNKAFAVTYAGGALAIGAVVLWLLGRRERRLTAWGAWLPALMVVFDAAFILAPHYVQTMPAGYVAENELVRYLKREVGHNRTAMATKDGFYNFWLTYLFPYHGIPTIEVTQLPRPPADYVAFWNALRDPVRMWQLTAVSHVLAHGQVAAQLLANPDWARQLEVAWAYQPYDDEPRRSGGAQRGAFSAGAGSRAEDETVPPRVAAVQSWRVADDAEALKTLGSASFEPYRSVLLAPGSEVCAPPAGDPGPAPEVEIERLIPGRCEFTVKNHGPVVMRVAEKFDPNWKATVNGQSRPVLRVDYMFQGVAIEEAGTHRVVLAYRPSSLPVVLQWIGVLAGLGAAGWLAVPRRRKEAAA